MDKNFVIAMVLMILVFVVWSSMFAPKPDEEAALDGTEMEATETPAEAPAETPETSPTPAVAKKEPVIDPETGEAIEEPEPELPYDPTGPVNIQTVSVQTPLYTAEMTNDGAVVTSWRLKKYMDKTGPDGKPYDMVWTANSGLYALTTGFKGPDVNLATDADYELVGNDGNNVVFRRVTDQGLEVTKSFEFSHDAYLVNLTYSFRNLSKQTLQGQAQVYSYVPVFESKGGLFKPQIRNDNQLAYIDDKLQKEQTTKARTEIEESQTKSMEFHGTSLEWAGFDSIYFLQAIAPGDPRNNKLIAVAPATEKLANVVTAFNKILSPGETAEFHYACYFGPKEENALAAAGHKFDYGLDYGTFNAIARWLVSTLNFFYKYLHNYGLAIILMTALIKLVLLPLTQKSYKSMKSMQKLQPEMKELREKYKDDRDTLNQKMMELYRKHKVNPASGCFPILLQLPIFFAFYRALYSSIELRHTPFFGWIQDLSAPDPYYITPILMGVSMFVTQKMTPSAGDPMQQKIMMALPIVFTFMFLNFPSGLVIYWLVNNILTIFQQLYINRKTDDDEPAQLATAKGKK